MLDLAVVVVTWNTRDLTLQALESLYADLDAHGPSHTCVYVVDNASSDDTAQNIADKFPQVRLIPSDLNLGFAAGNNLALREIGFGRLPHDDLPQAVYLLNPDTITQPGATRTLYDALMNDRAAGLVGAALVYGDGSFQHSAFHFPGLRQLWVEFFPTPGRLYENAFNGRYPRGLYGSDQPFEIDFPLGATMMIRREVIEQTEGFDEQFFMYCEEIDWAWRIHKRGWSVKCVPSAHVMHLEGQSTKQARPQSVVNLWRSRLLLFHKHYAAWKVYLARWMIALGMGLKARQISRDEQALLEAYREVRRLALRGLD